MGKDEKVKFVKMEINDTVTSITFASYLKTDYVNRSILVMINKENKLIEIFFNSNNYGTVHWENGLGLRDCHKWESEDEAKSSSYLTRRYTALLSDGMENLDYAEKNIITDVLDNMENEEYAKLFWNIVKEIKYDKAMKFKLKEE